MASIHLGGISDWRRRARLTSLLALAAAVAVVVAAAPADASRKPTRSEARAIKRAFLDEREVRTAVRRIRVSTDDPRFAAVSYAVTVPEPAPRLPARRRADRFPAPTPEILKEGKGDKWKPVAKPPKKVKDLKPKKAPKSGIEISGEVGATLTRSAACSPGYHAGIYNPGADVYLSIEFSRWSGFHAYPALGVRSVASLAVGNNAGVPQFETGQGNDAFAPSGVIYVDSGGWGIIDATMARQPDESGTHPQTVTVSGYWVCR